MVRRQGRKCKKWTPFLMDDTNPYDTSFPLREDNK